MAQWFWQYPVHVTVTFTPACGARSGDDDMGNLSAIVMMAPRCQNCQKGIALRQGAKFSSEWLQSVGEVICIGPCRQMQIIAIWVTKNVLFHK